MRPTFLILYNPAITDHQLYRIYQLNTPFDQDTIYTLNDGTTVQITGPEGSAAFISPIFSNSRKSNNASWGEVIKIDDPKESKTIVSNLRMLIENGKIELPGAISNVLYYSQEKDAFQYPIDPGLN